MSTSYGLRCLDCQRDSWRWGLVEFLKQHGRHALMLLDEYGHTSPLPEACARRVATTNEERYRLTLQAISKSKLTGVEFGDWVQAVCDDALAGEWPECSTCETAVHDGPCVEVG